MTTGHEEWVRREELRMEEPPRLRELIEAWLSVEADPEFARDLAAIGAADTPADDPWG